MNVCWWNEHGVQRRRQYLKYITSVQLLSFKIIIYVTKAMSDSEWMLLLCYIEH